MNHRLARCLLLLALTACDDGGQDPGDARLADASRADQAPADRGAPPDAALDAAPDAAPAPDADPDAAPPSPDAAPPDAAPPAPDAAPPAPDAAPPPVCGDGILGPGEACDGEPACVDCAWPTCEELAACPGPILLAPNHQTGLSRPRLSGTSLVASNPSAEHSGSRTAGEVFVFQADGAAYTRVQTLRAGDPSRDASFGQHLGLTGDTLAISEPGRQRIHLYRYDGAQWAPEAVVGSGPIRAMTLAPDRLVVGDRNASRDAGVVRVFERGPEGWAEAPAPVPAGLARGDRFGSAVALSGDWLLVGATDAAGGAGAVHPFRRTALGWEASPPLSLPIEGLGLGRVLALSGDAGVIGCEAFEGRGAAVFLSRGPDGWALEAPLSPPQIRAGDRLGAAVAIEGDRALVHARGPGGGGPDAATGRVLVFDRGPDGWAMTGELRHPGRGGLGASLDLHQGVISAGLNAWWARFDNGVSTYTSAVAIYR